MPIRFKQVVRLILPPIVTNIIRRIKNRFVAPNTSHSVSLSVSYKLIPEWPNPEEGTSWIATSVTK
jgi:hypothetical protein